MMAVLAGVAGISTYAATGSVWMALGRMGLMMASTLLTPKNDGAVATESGSTVPAIDPGLGFAPFPQYPSPEMPVPIIYGQSRLNGIVIHSRIYGSDYEKAHYLVVLGEVGLTLDQLYIDKYKIEDLGNYYTRTGGNQDENSSWYTFHPLGGQANIALNNTGTWNVFQLTDSPGDIAAPVPATFYGSGTLTCHSYHSWTQSGNTQTWQWEITNIDDPGQVFTSPVFSEYFVEQVTVDSGKESQNVSTAGSTLREHVFTISEPLSRWAVKLKVIEILKGIDGAGWRTGSQVGIYKFDTLDAAFTESFPVNAAYAHVHLVKDAAIGSSNPVISALVHSSVVTGLGGNPADAMLTFLTDPVLGLGLPAESLDGSSQYAAAYWCEQNGFGFNRAYAAFYDAEQVFREICTAGRLMTLVRGGRITLKPDAAEPAACKVGETEIIPGSLKVGIQSSSRPNRIEAQYVEPYYGYTIERIYVEDLAAIARDGLQTQTVDLSGVTDQTQAYRLAWFILRTIQDCPYWCRFTVGMETARILPLGGVIEIESTTNPLAGTKKWRVLSIEEIESFVYQIECAQYSESVYEEPAYSPWYNQMAELEAVQGWPGPAAGPASVVNFQITNTLFPTGGGMEITVDWVHPTLRYDLASIQWSHNGNDWNAVASVVNGPYTFTWPMRYGLVHIRAVTLFFNISNADHAPMLTLYIGGTHNGDYPGFGQGQYGMQPYGY